MTHPSPLSVASRTPLAPSIITKTVTATVDKALSNSNNIDVDEYFYTPIVRSQGKQPSDSELMKALDERGALFGLRLDFIVGDQCRFTIVGNRR